MSLKHLSLEHWSLTIIIHLSFILNVFQRTLPVFFRILFFWETVLRTQVNNKLSPFLFLFLISFLDFCLSVLSWNCNAQTMFSCSYRIKGIRKKVETFSKEKKIIFSHGSVGIVFISANSWSRCQSDLLCSIVPFEKINHFVLSHIMV